MSGTLLLKPIQGSLKHNKDLLKRMDPYCEFILGGQKIKSTVCRNGGRNPSWGDVLTLRSNNESVLYVKLMDKDTFTRDDDIGMCQVDLMSIYSSYNKGAQWYPIFHNQKEVGELLLDITYTGTQGMTQQFYAQQAPIQRGIPAYTNFPNPSYPQGQMPTTFPMMQGGAAYIPPAYPTSHPNIGYPTNHPNIGYPQVQPPINQNAYPNYAPNQPTMNYAPHITTHPQAYYNPNQGYPSTIG